MSRFKPRTIEEARENFRPMKRGQMSHSSGFGSKRRKPVNKMGPRTREWLSVWRFLKPKLEAAGRTSCEFDFVEHHCWGPLDPVHSKKRRELQGNDIYAVAIGCREVHTYLDEACTHEKMCELVMEAINRHGGLILPNG
jgi:hypothetical protein